MTMHTSRTIRGRRQRREGRVWLVLLIILAMIGGAGFGWWKYFGSSNNDAEKAPVTQAIARGPFDHIVLEQGEIESSSNVEVKCEVKGKGRAARRFFG